MYKRQQFCLGMDSNEWIIPKREQYVSFDVQVLFTNASYVWILDKDQSLKGTKRYFQFKRIDEERFDPSMNRTEQIKVSTGQEKRNTGKKRVRDPGT